MALAEAAEARKARLLALKRRKDGEIIKNRNFDPESRTLKKRIKAGRTVEMEDTVEKNVEGVAEQIIAEGRAEEGAGDVFNIAPKRPNWDLKRETDKKLAKLERKTQEAIHTLIRQRLKGGEEDIVGAMKAQEKAQQDLSDDEDE
ncbi:mRNA splicing factor [Armillaria novae-zelandiae]|uniref:mRNA splicing factor n=1 Tax=Armillaria novae-zelandiae TaxID=153914 RepID=A0AA39PC79_9AGAR|nr:mRNA splicing factor [Armillaria novae-zelandiae]